MSLLKLAAAVLAGWTLIRLAGRVQRLEEATGVWRVQPPWESPAWWASDEFDRALAQWSYHVEIDPSLTDERIVHAMKQWIRDQRGDAA